MDALDDLIGMSSALEALRGAVRQLVRTSGGARRPPAVLITGETGTGKGLVARLLHQAGPRAHGPLVEMNCAAIPETLLEAELFGYERGAFTGAQRSKPGLFQVAHGGTLFLDEIALMSPAVQAKLLKVIEDRAVRRLGAVRDEPVDVWVLSATNADVAAEIRAGGFREDLYHRLAVVTLSVPALRDREDDAVLLAEHFLARACHDYGVPRCRLGPEARRAILAHPWPGNVRELANAMERVALLAESPQISAALLGFPRPAAPAAPRERGRALEDALREHVRAVLVEWEGNITRAAAALGITRNTLRGYIEKFELTVPATARSRRGRRRAGGGEGGPPEDAEALLQAARPDEDARREPDVAAADEVSSSAPPPSGRGPLRWTPRWVAFLGVTLRGRADLPVSGYASAIQDLFELASGFGGQLEDVKPHGMVMAFGVDAAEDGPRRAAAAALAARGALARRAASEAVPIGGGFALHVARCVVASGAGVDRVDRGDRAAALAILDALGVAVEDSAILASPAAVRHLGRRFELAPTPHAAAGAGGAHALVGRERTDFAGAGHAPSRFVGRTADLAMLHARFADALAGRGQGVAIAGEAGVGKSRLVYEFRRSLEPKTVTFLEGRCLSYGATTPYLPIIDVVRHNFGVAEGDDAAAAAAAFRVGLEALGLDADSAVPHLLHLLGFRAGTESLQGQSPEAIRRATLEVFGRLIAQGSVRQPIVVGIEDLQWSDRSSEAVIDALIAGASTARILLLTTHRPGYRPPWLGRSHVSQLALGPLSPAEGRAVLRSALSPALADRVGERILALAEGVPFFIEELARTVAERAHEIEPLALPETVESALTARLDRLATADRDVLQAASVIGREFSPAVLGEVTGAETGEVARALERLRAAEFLVDRGAGDARACAFKHTLTHEVTYRGLLSPLRRELHGRVARALERSDQAVGERWPEILAHHHAESGRASEAIGYWLRAAQLALRRSATAEAIAQLGRGLALLDALPAGPEREERELVLQLTLCTALAGHHGYAAPEVEATMVRVRELTRVPQATAALLVGRFALWRFAISRADFAQAEELATQLSASVAEETDPQRLIPAHIAVGVTGFYLGDLPRAEEYCRTVAAWHEPGFGPSQAALYGQDLGVAAWSYLGWTLALRGRLDEGAAAAERALALARQGGHRFTLALALHWCGLVRGERREARAVAAHGEELLALSREQHFEFFVALAIGLRGWARAIEGDAAGALALLREGSERYRQTGQRLGVRLRVEEAAALLAAGAPDDALAVTEEALALVGSTREGAIVSEIYRVRAEALARRSPADAGALLERAVAIACAQGADVLALRAATSLVRVRRADGEASAALATLRGIYGRIPEGGELPDLVAARRLLEP